MTEQVEVLFVPPTGEPEIKKVRPILSDIQEMIGGPLQYNSLGKGIIVASAENAYRKGSLINFYTRTTAILGKVVIYRETEDGEIISLTSHEITELNSSLNRGERAT